MTETKTEFKVEKRTPKKATDTSDKHAHFERKSLKVGDEISLTKEVESMAPGTLGKVAGIQFDGAVFIIEILTGPRHGETFRIKAEDLKLVPVPKSELFSEESEGGK